MNKGTLILICGLPGAGKTTLAKKLASKRQAVRLCPDDWILGVLKDKNDLIERDRLREPMEQLLWRHAQTLLKFGMTVILENGFWSRVERESYRQAAKELGVKVELLFVQADLPTLWERVEKRNNNPQEMRMTKKELEDSFKVFEAPTSEEGLNYDYYSTLCAGEF